MAYSLKVEDAPGYLAATLGGGYMLADALAALERIAVISRERKAQRILLDMSNVTGDIPDLDRYDIGKEAAEVFPHIDRLAIIMPSDGRYTGFTVDVAANRGLNMQAFHEKAPAVAWVTGG